MDYCVLLYNIILTGHPPTPYLWYAISMPTKSAGTLEKENTMDNTTNNERADAIAKFVNEFTANQLAEHLVDREAEIDRLDDERRRLNRSVKADDSRVLELLKEMYDVMVNNSCAHLWSNFVDSIDGMPDLSTRKYGGVITLKFYFSDVEIAGDIADWEIEDAIIEAIRNDLSYSYADETEVDYEEEN